MRTQERRDRVLQLWGKKDSHISAYLLKEGFDVDSGPAPVHPDDLDVWEKRRQSSMRRNVWSDRRWWEERWRDQSKIPRTHEDHAVERESHVAGLRSDLDDIDDMIIHKDTKSSTAKANLQGLKLQARAMIAKARGVDKVPESVTEPGDEAPSRPAILIYDISVASAETKAKYGLKSDGENRT